MIKWLKFYVTGSNIVQTIDVATGKEESVGEETLFTTADEAVSKSTVWDFIVWDGKPVSVGALSEPEGTE